MIAFWIAAALLSAAVAVLIVLNAARAQTRQHGEDPTVAVYRRQLDEIDDLAVRGLLPEAERRSARTEAARRLLVAADAAPAAPTGSGARAAVIGAAIAAPLIALAAYLIVGSPETPDQPYARRLAAWTAEAGSSGETGQQLTSPELAAVLRTVVAKRPADPVALVYLAHAEVDSGDLTAAQQDLKRAIALDPKRGQLWQLLGATIAMQAGDQSPEARAAFERALALDPRLPTPYFYLGRAKIAAGDVKGGLAEWTALLALLPATNPARAGLQQEIASVQKTGALPASPDVQGAGADQQSMIRAMVARLAARLRAQPDDPEGWGRLIRSYAVLGEQPERTAALNAAHAEFKDRPQLWARVEQAEAAPQ